MKTITLPLGEIALLVSTRAILGVGLGLLLGGHLSERRRVVTGWTLCLIGAVTTVPLGLDLYGALRASGGDNGRHLSAGSSAGAERKPQVAGT